jgi:hypothetical protein
MVEEMMMSQHFGLDGGVDGGGNDNVTALWFRWWRK